MMQGSIQLFDSNAHPTVTGRWPSKDLDASFARLSKDLNRDQFRGACAVGVWGLEDYSHAGFLALCRKYPNLVPIAGYYPLELSAIRSDLKAIQIKGYRGIKIHPRDPHIGLSDPRITGTFQVASELGIPILLCTYFHSGIENYPTRDPLYDIVTLLQDSRDARVMLVHGGDVNLLRYAELVRFNPSLLLDLSLTFMKYRGTSLDMDIRFLFEQFDRRICIGTDFPEYTHEEVHERFVEMSRGLARDKVENIAFRNVENFLQI